MNPYRGDVTATLGGRRRTLRLTLGALAELEAALGAGDLVALAERFEAGRLSAREAIAIIGAGLRGAGERTSDEEVAAMMPEGGAAGALKLVADLIRGAFG